MIALQRVQLGTAIFAAMMSVGCGELGGPTTPATAQPTPSSTATSASLTPSGVPSASPTSTPSPSAAPSVLTADQAMSLAQSVFPPSALQGRTTYGTCSSDQCPFTSRLSGRVGQHPLQGADAICRCQNGSETFASTADALTASGGVAHVSLFDAGLGLDLIIIRQNSDFLVDDIQCSGKGASTSIYSDPIPAC